jgi:hypothetical protein
MVTSFTHDNQQYMFRKAPFGLPHVSSFVSRCLSNLFADLKHVCTFIDDITVFTHDDLEYHTECVTEVLKRLTNANLKINPEKLHLGQTKIFILGFCLSADYGLTIDERKVSNVLDWPEITSGTQLSSFLGLTNYFRAHIPNYSHLSAKLDQLRNKSNFKQSWTAEHAEAVEKLKLALVSATVLSVPDPRFDLNVVTDSSSFGYGAALYQVNDKREIKYIGFIARTISDAERRWGSYRRELGAVVFAFTRFRQWLRGRKFHLFVDNKAILYIHSKEKVNLAVENWYDTIYEMNFDITFCKGISNILADQLSRLFVPHLVGDDGLPLKRINRNKAKIIELKDKNEIVPIYESIKEEEKSEEKQPLKLYNKNRILQAITRGSSKNNHKEEESKKISPSKMKKSQKRLLLPK